MPGCRATEVGSATNVADVDVLRKPGSVGPPSPGVDVEVAWFERIRGGDAPGMNAAVRAVVRTALDRVRQLADPALISRASMMLGLLLQRQGRDRPARAALAGPS